MSKKGSFLDNPFGGMFDFNRDGKEDFGEQWLAYKIFLECTKEDNDDADLNFDDDDFSPSTTYQWRTRVEVDYSLGVYPEHYETEEEYYENDFFGKKAGLTVSAQLEGEMAAMGLGKIYTFGPTFRAEHSNTVRHAAEFWHVEPEVCFTDINELIEIIEDFIKYIIKDVLDNCPEEMKFFDAWVEKGLIEKLNGVISSDFVKLDYTDAIKILETCGKEFKYPAKWGDDLQTEHEKYLTDEHFKKPVFVVNYPKDIKSFYMKQNPDGKTVAATDLLVPGIGEIIGGSEREADLDKLLNAMNAKGMDLSSYGNYIDTRRYGSVEHSGFGLGFERALMYLTGVSNIRDTLLFPRTVGSL